MLLDPSIDSDQVIAGRRYLLFICGLQLATGLILIVEAGLVIQTSGAYYTGAWYLGLINVLTGFRGCIIKTVSSAKWLLCWATLDAVVAAVACALVLPEYLDSREYKACASYNDYSSFSCGFASNITCYGDTLFYRNVSQCEVSFIAGQNDDYQFLGDQCDCITSSYTCHSFDYIPSCSAILNFLPEGLLASFWVSVVSLCLSLSLFFVCVLSVYYPYVFLSDEEIARQQQHILQVAEARVAERTERGEPERDRDRDNIAIASVISPLHFVDEDNNTVVSAAVGEPSTIVLRPSEVVVLRETEMRQREIERAAQTNTGTETGTELETKTEYKTETEIDIRRRRETNESQPASTVVAEAVIFQY